MLDRIDAEVCCAIFTLRSREVADAVCTKLQRNGLDMRQMSIVCREPAGIVQRRPSLPGRGLFPRDLWGMEFGFAMNDAELGSVFVGGVVAGRAALGMSNDEVDVAETPLKTVLSHVGVPADWLSNYGIVLKCGRCLLFVESTLDHIRRTQLHLDEHSEDTIGFHLLKFTDGQQTHCR